MKAQILWNDKAFMKSLDEYVVKQNKRAVVAVGRGLQVVRRAIVTRTPVVTGRLKGSIEGVSGVDSINEVTNKDGVVTGKMGTTVPYAKYVEFGTSRFKGRRMFTAGINASKRDLLNVIKNTLSGK